MFSTLKSTISTTMLTTMLKELHVDFSIMHISDLVDSLMLNYMIVFLWVNCFMHTVLKAASYQLRTISFLNLPFSYFLAGQLSVKNSIKVLYTVRYHSASHRSNLDT